MLPVWRGSVWEDLEEGTRRSGRRSTLKNARTKVGEDEEKRENELRKRRILSAGLPSRRSNEMGEGVWY